MGALRYGEPAGDTGRFGNTYFRWTLLHTLIVIAICSMPVWLSWLAPRPAAIVNAAVLAFISLIWLCIATCAVCNMARLVKEPLMAEPGAERHVPLRKFKHIVVVPCYLDPIDVLFDCLCSLATQGDPLSLVVVVAFEKKTPELKAKVDTVTKGFEGRFGELIISVHTIAWATEIPGGCSNKNFALRSAHQHVSTKDPDYQNTSYTVTTCDTDSLFPPRYFEVLERCYDEENPQADSPVKLCVWQGPLFYNWDLDARPFFVRITGIMRSLMMMGGLIAFNLNPMSVFSYPLELGLSAGFINPRYSVDDIIFLVRMMCSSGRPIPVKLLPVPVISGPTIGTTWWQEVREWARQLRRWIIGSSESFHYFLMHYKGHPLLAGLKWFLLFFTYYALLLCCGGLVGVVASIPLPWQDSGSPILKLAGPAALGVQFVVFITAFILDRVAVRHMTVKEEIGVLRNLLHLLLAPVVLLVYSLIAFYAVVKFAFRGKKDAGHIMAAKAGFGAVTAAQATQQADTVVDAEAGPAAVPDVEPEGSWFDCPEVHGHSFRSTSTRSFGSLAETGGPLLQDPESPLALPANIREDVQVLCRPPDCFFFGQTALPLGDEPRSGRKVAIYGAEGLGL